MSQRRQYASTPFAQAHIERALAAVTDVRGLEAQHQVAEFRQRQPLRHLPSQHAPRLALAAHTLAGDDQHELEAVAMRAMQEARERAMRLALRQAVQIELGVDRLAATRELLARAAIERRQWFWRRRRGRRGRPR